MNPKDFTLHSGGAKGADTAWGELGRAFGVTNQEHYRPKDFHGASLNTKIRINLAVQKAAIALGRSGEFKGIDLVKRNYFQVENSEAVYAVSYLVAPGEKDLKGFKNTSGKIVVSGGTGWAIEMAMQQFKPVFVFDMNENKWYKGELDIYRLCDVPTLTKDFAGIGSRELTKTGLQAVEDVYRTTFN